MTEIADEAFELDAVSNPALVEAALKMSTNTDPPELDDPLDGPVRLVAGFRRVRFDEDKNRSFEEVSTAWVRELNGEDEEKIARTRLKGDENAFLDAVLKAGVEKFGDEEPTRDDFNSLVLGDRNYLLLEIARSTYGDSLEYESITCPTCGEDMAADLSLSSDIPLRRLDDLEDRTFEVKLRKGKVAVVTLPTVEMSAAISKTETASETNTVLISNCVSEIKDADGKSTPVRGDAAAAKRLGIVDRQTIVTEMAKRMPGPQYNEVRFNHEPGCGEEIRLTVQLADLFRGL